MMALVVLISALVLAMALTIALAIALGSGALGWWMGGRPRTESGAPPPRADTGAGRDGLTEGGDGETGLAAFYAYQIAAGKIERAP